MSEPTLTNESVACVDGAVITVEPDGCCWRARCDTTHDHPTEYHGKHQVVMVFVHSHAARYHGGVAAL